MTELYILCIIIAFIFAIFAAETHGRQKERTTMIKEMVRTFFMGGYGGIPATTALPIQDKRITQRFYLTEVFKIDHKKQEIVVTGELQLGMDQDLRSYISDRRYALVPYRKYGIYGTMLNFYISAERRENGRYYSFGNDLYIPSSYQIKYKIILIPTIIYSGENTKPKTSDGGNPAAAKEMEEVPPNDILIM